MAMTIDSGLASYCTPAQFLVRYDQRSLAQLLSDTGIDISDVTNEPKLAQLLQEASAILESACLIGERYSTTDLANLAASATNMGQLIAGIVADIAIKRVFMRRPDVTMPRISQIEETERWLAALADGTRIFGFTEAEKAGHMSDTVETPQDVENRNLITFEARRLFGTRGNRLARTITSQTSPPSSGS